MERLTELEEVIAKGRDHFVTVGRALREIRDKRLYQKALFDTFELYVRGRWDMGRAHAYRMIAFCDIMSNLSPIGDILPENEAQVRPLARLTPCEQRELWKDFVKSGATLTARSIKKFIDDRNKSPEGPDLSERISNEYKAAVRAMIDQVRVARQDHWQGTSRQAALLWNRVVREKILEKEKGHG